MIYVASDPTSITYKIVCGFSIGKFTMHIIHNYMHNRSRGRFNHRLMIRAFKRVNNPEDVDMSIIQNIFLNPSKLNLSPDDERSVATDPKSEL